MRTFGSVTCVYLPIGCVLMIGSARLFAQTTAVDSALAALPEMAIQRPDTAKPYALGERTAKPAIFTGYRVDQEPADAADDQAAKHKQRVIWGAILGGTVVATVVGDWTNGGRIDFPESAIPVAGPFIALARYDDVITNRFYSGSTLDKVLFAASGAVQTVALVMIIRSLRGGAGKEAGSRTNVPVISLVPTGRRGFLLSYKMRFRGRASAGVDATSLIRLSTKDASD